ncbi:MAG: TonB-dependent receptor plug domain-containing protein [Bacteroidetes bacterium]|nr:TonB-dependent receptor plug domain-containing protein [Bacteroidota bacterium]MBU1720606.1 TonB-dependent receptor plug domain-containing protein [Bacteroidota bacterium]
MKSHYGQSLSDTISLVTFEVVDSVAPFREAGINYSLDSALMAAHDGGNLTELLAAGLPVHIRQYGPGSLASVSYRGNSASHTQLEWNGVLLNSPMNGQSDLSTFPVFLTDEINFTNSAASLHSSSGAFGGKISLNTESQLDKGHQVSMIQSIGSFNSLESSVSVGISDGQISSKTRIFRQSSDNNYPFVNYAMANDPVETQNHASFASYGALQELHYKLKKGGIYAKFLYTNSDRLLPAVITASSLDENQNDMLVVGMIGYYKQFKKSSLKSSVSLIQSEMGYNANIIDLHANHQMFAVQKNLEYTHHFGKKTRITASKRIISNSVHSGSFQNKKSRLNAGFGFKLEQKINHHFVAQFTGREEFADNRFSPFLPSAEITYQYFRKKSWRITAGAFRNFRFPTMNDRYWQPGGNPDLKPELQDGCDLVVSFSNPASQKKPQFEVTSAAFLTHSDDLITWVPAESGNIWMAMNYKDVWTKGAEVSGKLSHTFRKCRFAFDIKYQYCRSEYGDDYESSNCKGKQVIYTPESTGTGGFLFGFHHFFLRYENLYTGLRYISSDNQWFLPAYDIQNIYAGKNFEINSNKISISFACYNLTNTQYECIAYRPMPGRWVKGTIRVYLKSTK